MEEKKENKLVAILLCTLVVILGAGVWGLVYSYGWFVSIIAYGIAFLAITVYAKFAKVTKPVYIIVAVAIAVFNIIASLFSIVIQASIETGLKISEVMKILFENFSEIAVEFSIDCLLGTVFTVLGVVSYYRFYKQKQRDESVAKLQKTSVSENTENVETVESDETEKTEENNEYNENNDQTDEEN